MSVGGGAVSETLERRVTEFIAAAAINNISHNTPVLSIVYSTISDLVISCWCCRVDRL